jgi:hypothetical protein
MPQFGALKPSQQYYQSSGEATPQGVLPEKFVSTVQPTSRVTKYLDVPPDWNGNVRRQPIVQRAQRTVGMQYLYSRGHTRMPIRRLGADGPPYPFNSAAEPDDMGPIRNAGFNRALFQAGYPGYNLGLSFKVPTLESNPRNATQGGRTATGNRSTGPVDIRAQSQQTVTYGRSRRRGLGA